MKAFDVLIPVSILLACGIFFTLLVFLLGFIAERRRAHHSDRIRKLALLGVVVSTFGFLWALLGGFRAGLPPLMIGIAPGFLIWLIALIWACRSRGPETTRGFEVQPLIGPSGDRMSDQ
jgi:amino acid transporter